MIVNYTNRDEVTFAPPTFSDPRRVKSVAFGEGIVEFRTGPGNTVRPLISAATDYSVEDTRVKQEWVASNGEGTMEGFANWSSAARWTRTATHRDSYD